MQVTYKPVSKKEALQAASILETVLSEIASGKRKPSNIPLEEIIQLIQFARDTVPPADWISVSEDGRYVYFRRSNWAHANGEKEKDKRFSLVGGMDGDTIARLKPMEGYVDVDHIRIMLANSGQGENRE